MRLFLVLGSIGFVSACTSARKIESAAPAPQTMQASITSISSISNVEAVNIMIPYPVDRVWSQLPAVYETLGIPIGTFDMAGRTMGNTALKLRRQLGKAPLSRYLECGSAQGTSSADAYEVYMSVLSKVTATDDGGTKLTTTIEAQARPASLSGQYFSCASKHTLEKTIADQIRLKGP